MTWSISRSGNREDVVDGLQAEKFAGLAEDSPERADAERARDYIAGAFLDTPEASACSVSASGGHDSNGHRRVSMTLDVGPPAAAAPEGGFVGLLLAGVIALCALVFGSYAFAASPAPADDSREIALAAAARELAPRDLPTAAIALEHARAAVAAERSGISAEVLLAVAYVETHYTAGAQSAHGRGRYCGVLQATRDRDGWTCAELKDLETGYEAGAMSLERWSQVCRKWRAGDRRLRCALAGYGGIYVNGSRDYPGRVMRRAKQIRKRAGSGT